MQLPIRDGTQEDWPYILDSFVKSYSESPHARGASRAVLASLMEPVLRAWRTRVAFAPGDESVIVGFVIHEPRPRSQVPCVAWLQVRSEWRRRGVAAALLADVGVSLGAKLEVETPFLVQRIGRDRKDAVLVRVAERYNVTVRFRPYLPLELQRLAAAEALRAGAA